MHTAVRDGTHLLRRIELRLDVETEDAERIIRLLTNLPDRIKASALAQLHRRRWRIENLFQRLESVLHSEVRTLGAPRATLLAFGVALLAYNVLTLLKTALRIQHERVLKKTGMEISPYYIAVELRAYYAGMVLAMAVEMDAWERYRSLNDKQLAKTLLKLAATVDPTHFHSYPRKSTIKKKRSYVSKRAASSHVSTARALAKGKKSP